MKRKKIKVLTLFDAMGPPPADFDLSAELKKEDRKTERNVLDALAKLGHTAEHLVIFDDLDAVRQKLQGLHFTGCGSSGLLLCKNKGISKKILGYHRIHVPNFVTIARGKRIARPRKLNFPILVKPLKEEASLGISQASFVENDDQFKERVQFIHDKYDNDVIAEEYIEGRELYVGILGCHRLQVFPIRELVFKQVPPDEPKIATYKAKWDEEYRKRWGLENQFAESLDPAVARKIESTCKRIYRLLTIDGYARIDLRLTPQNEIYFIEANPNPILAEDEDFAQSAQKGGVSYPDLIDRIIRTALHTVRD